MHPVDILIVLLAISSVVRGFQIGLVRQAGSTIGFVGGLFLGSYIVPHLIPHASTSLSRSLISILLVIVISLSLMSAGEFIGIKLKIKLLNHRLDALDGGLGSLMGIVTLLFGVWLLAAMLLLSPQLGLQTVIKQSRIIAELDRLLPPAPQLLGTLNKLINPNGFPQVFAGLEPSPQRVATPSIGSLQPAVQADKASIVKVEGTGCGGIVEGSGFIFAKNKIATNAHVVAGVKHPQVLDDNGVHDTRVVWFDPNLDLAVLDVQGLAGKPLNLNTDDQPRGTAAAVAGYPGGGDFSAQPASIIERFTASGRDIYGQGNTERQIYSVQAKVIPGNSGGPLIGTGGQVLGIVFATSTTYNDVGYVLTAKQVSAELSQARQSTTTYTTGSCSE